MIVAQDIFPPTSLIAQQQAGGLVNAVFLLVISSSVSNAVLCEMFGHNWYFIGPINPNS